MKHAMLIIALIASIGCGDPAPTQTLEVKHSHVNMVITVRYESIVIEGCEYLLLRSEGSSLCHKGNCNNSIHRYDKSLEVHDE